MRPFFVALALSVALGSAARADLRCIDDAALHAVQFVDPKVGWAVGDEGVVWHTIDGGATWELQPTLTGVSLRSLHFANALVGWVAGREELAGGGSAGVLLYTRDGGASWLRVMPNTLPGINHVHFADPKTGYLLCDASEQYPAGVFRSKDGGRTWQPLPGPRGPGYLAGGFKDADTAALAGPWGRLATLRTSHTGDLDFGKADVEKLGGRSVRGLHLRDERAIAVGQGGLVLTSNTSGRNYGYPDLKLSDEVRNTLDFHCVHGAGEHVWVTGRPGSVVLHSANHGGTWQVQHTGQNLPLNGIHFFDENRGWAVGEYGVILATEDGGKKWAVQQRGGQRAAILFLNARGRDCPLDTMAVLGGEEGYLTTAVRVAAAERGSAALARAGDPQRFHTAVRQAGGGCGELLWQFPVPQHLADAGKQELLAFWNDKQLHAGNAARELRRQLVLALRTWRPDVVVVDHPDARATGNAAGALVAEALHEAFLQAADPKEFPEQIDQLGLRPWTTSKVYALWDKRQDAQVIVDGSADQPRLETNAREYAAGPMRLLADPPVLLPMERAYRLLDNRIDGAAGKSHFLAGVPDAGGCRRTLGPLLEPGAEVKKAIHACRNLRNLVESPVVGLADTERMLAAMAPALKHLPDDYAAVALYAMASQYAQRGQWLLAREAYLLLVDRFPNSPRAVDGYRWLVRHNGSSEARRRDELDQFVKVSTSAFPAALLKQMEGQGIPGGVVSPDGKQRFQPAEKPVAQVTYLSNLAETRKWYLGSVEIAKQLNALGPLYANDPELQFCLQAARRQLGQVVPAQEWYAGVRTQQKDGPWREVAAQELWKLSPVGLPPRPVLPCRRVEQKPFLDGKFDDACWQNVKPVALQNAVQDTAKTYPTEVRMGYDQKYLYLAVRCQHPKGCQVAPVKARPRDADLRPYDRVSLMLDLDRDYSTYFRLEVDQRGCVCEDCWGDKSWNPQWYVAIRSDEESWQVEAAIPLHELTGQVVPINSAWACNVVRTLPGRGVQALSVPADVEPRPEGMSLLLFQEAPPPQMAPVAH